MSDNPWHKRYHSDALTGFQGLTLEERGAYQTLLDLMYDRQEPLCDDTDDRMRFIAGYLGVGLRKYRSVTQSLIQKGKLHRLSNGRLSNKRFEKESKLRQKTSEKHAKNGKKGGEKSGEIRKKRSKNNDYVKQTLPENRSLYQKPEVRSQKLETQTTQSAASGGFSKAAAAAVDVIGDRCLQAMGIDPKDPTYTGNYGWVTQWLANGWDVEMDILPTIERLTARRRSLGQGMPKSLNFFTEAIGDTHAGRKAGQNVVPFSADTRPKQPPPVLRDYEWASQAKRFENPGERVDVDGYSLSKPFILRKLKNWFIEVEKFGENGATFHGINTDRLAFPPGDKDAVWPKALLTEASALAEAEINQATTG